MSGPETSIGEVLSRLEREGLLGAAWQRRAEQTLAGLEESQPWYVRAMVGFGGWFSSLLLIGFVVGPSLIAGPVGFLILGLACLAGSPALRHRTGNDFAIQVALAVNLAGQGLFTFGVLELAGEEVEIAALTLILLNGLLVPIYPDRVFRFLAVNFMVTALVVLLYSRELQVVLPLLVPALAALFVRMVSVEDGFSVRGWDHLARPLMAGLIFAAFGCTLLSTIYLLPEFIGDFVFFPRPWISTIGLGILLLLVEYRFLPDAFGSTAAYAAYAVTLLLILTTLPAPGVTLSLLVLVLGTARGNGFMTGIGIAFLGVFTLAWFYGMETSLLTKSYSLVGAGVAVLAGRWLLLRLIGPGQETGHS